MERIPPDSTASQRQTCQNFCTGIFLFGAQLLTEGSLGFITDRIWSMGESNLFTGVCHSVHPGTPSSGCTPSSPVDALPPPVDESLSSPVDASPPLQLMWMHPLPSSGCIPLAMRQTVNRQPVRILLECILVADSLESAN